MSDMFVLKVYLTSIVEIEKDEYEEKRVGEIRGAATGCMLTQLG